MTRLRLATADTFRSFQHRNFRRFFAGQAVSQIGTWLQLVAQVLLVLRLSNSGVAIGLLTAFQFLPVLVLGPWAGLICDRVDRRRLMLVTQSVLMVQAFALAAVVLSGRATVGLVYVLALLTGIANAFDNPARRVLISELVEPADVANAVGLNSTLMTSARIVGPALAAVGVQTVGIGWCFAVNGVSFLAVLWALERIDPAPMRAPARLPRGKGQIREGFRYVWRDRELRTAVLLMAVVSTLAFNWQVVLPLFAQRTLGGTELTYTLLTTVLSGGSLIGSLWVARRRELRLPTVARAALAFGLAIGALAVAPTLPVALPLAVVAGAVGIAYLSSTATLLQLRAAPSMRGRVMALHTMLFLGSTPIGGPLAGWVSERFGARAGLLLGAVPAALAAGVALRLLARRRMGNPADAEAAEPARGDPHGHHPARPALVSR